MNEAIAMSQQRPVECQGGAAVTICKPELDGIWIGYDDRRSKITSRSCQDSVQSMLKKHVSYFIVIIKTSPNTYRSHSARSAEALKSLGGQYTTISMSTKAKRCSSSILMPYPLIAAYDSDNF